MQFKINNLKKNNTQNITFADPNLEACVRETLGIDESTPITKDMVKDLISLYCDDKGITSLAGIEGSVHPIV